MAGELARRLRAKSVPYTTTASSLPRDESELTSFLQNLVQAGDWYAGKSPRDAQAIDGFVDYLFHTETPLKSLKLKPLSDGVTSEVLEIATGRGELDPDRNTSREKHLYLNETQADDDSSELSSLGSRPLHHPAWDRKTAEELRNRANPFTHGADASYFPDYSVHSPDQVQWLSQELGRVGDRVRGELGRVKSRRVRTDALTNFEKELVGPIEKAASAGLAVFAGWDY